MASDHAPMSLGLSIADSQRAQRDPAKDNSILLVTVFVVGMCTLIYELLIGSVSSYLVGNSLLQFSLTIGLSMTAMGIGTYLSRFIRHRLLLWFITIECLLGIIGGLSVPLLYTAFRYDGLYYPVMVALIVIIGVLIGLEIPLLTRMMDGVVRLRKNISNVLSLDYLGALVATFLFPFFLVPLMGLYRSSLVAGALNLAVGVLNLWYFRDHLAVKDARRLTRMVAAFSVALIALALSSSAFLALWEDGVYGDRVVVSQKSRIQQIVLTKRQSDVRLFLDGHLQFSSVDEFRYHEPLVHVPMGMLPKSQTPRTVVILGGGDGLAVRELLKYPSIQKITLVDLDAEVTKLAQSHPLLTALNGGSLKDPRVKVVHADGFRYLGEHEGGIDLIISDLPDPKTLALSKLYSREFYALIQRKLSRTGLFVTQATSPFFAKDTFWSIHRTMAAAGFTKVLPYHSYVPSFGDWGFIAAGKWPIDPAAVTVRVPTRFLTEASLPRLFQFGKDLLPDHGRTIVNTLDHPQIVSLYIEGWQQWH